MKYLLWIPLVTILLLFSSWGEQKKTRYFFIGYTFSTSERSLNGNAQWVERDGNFANKKEIEDWIRTIYKDADKIVILSISEMSKVESDRFYN